MGWGRTGGRNMITLKTLHLATAQEVFDQVKTHLLTQMERSVDFISYNKYRSHNGLKCAAGCLIADDEYTMDMEGRIWSSLVIENIIPDYHAILIRDLQFLHDCYQPPEWEERLEKVAKKHDLEWHE